MVIKALAVILYLITVHSIGMASETQILDAPRQYPFDLRGHSVAVDISGDALPDLISVIRTGADSLAVSLNDGEGRLETPFLITTGLNLFSISAGDFDGDGWVDLACLDGYPPQDLYIFRNDMELNFLAADSFMAVRPGYVDCFDLNGDQAADLVFYSFSVGGRILLLTDGVGGLLPPETVYGDILVESHTANTGQLLVRFNDGTGHFSDGPISGIPPGLGRVSALNLNGDMLPDIVGLRYDEFFPETMPGELISILNTGDGSFSGSQSTPTLHAPNGLWCGDIDGDGFGDAVVGGELSLFYEDWFDVMRGSGSGAFASTETHLTEPYSSATLKLVDMDGDSDLDALLGSDGTVVLKNEGNGLFDLPQKYVWQDHEQSLVADFDQDGYPDVVLASTEQRQFIIMRNLLGTGLEPWKSYVLCEGFHAFGTEADLQTGDVNGDDLPDVIVLCNDGAHSELQLFTSGGNDVLDPTPLSLPLGDFSSYSLAVGDFDGDQYEDVVVTHLTRSSVTVAFGTHTSGLADPVVISNLSGISSDIAAVDIDGDGRAEIIIAGDSLRILEYDGTSSLVVTASYPMDFSCGDLVVGNMDGDSAPEVIVADPWKDGGVWVYANDGSGLFGTPTPIYSGFMDLFPVLTAGDLNGDALGDIIAIGAMYDVAVFLNQGGHSFGSPQGFYGGPSASPNLADMDQDGDPDLVVSSGDGIRVLYNTVGEVTSIDESVTDGLPSGFVLHQNYPNPFNPSTIVEYSIPRAAEVRLTVYNILGQEVRTLVSCFQSPGNYSINWDGRDSRRQPVASGVYFYRLTADDISQTRKMLLLK
jgi:hypothetical protein